MHQDRSEDQAQARRAHLGSVKVTDTKRGKNTQTNKNNTQGIRRTTGIDQKGMVQKDKEQEPATDTWGPDYRVHVIV